MRIEGRLPSVAVNMTDQRLTDILQLLLGVPLPDRDVVPEDFDELDHAVSIFIYMIYFFSLPFASITRFD